MEFKTTTQSYVFKKVREESEDEFYLRVAFILSQLNDQATNAQVTLYIKESFMFVNTCLKGMSYGDEKDEYYKKILSENPYLQYVCNSLKNQDFTNEPIENTTNDFLENSTF